MTAIQITRLDAKDTAKATEVFFAAFERDPLMSYFFGDRDRDLAKCTMQYVCDRANLFNLPLLGALVEGEIQGVALITPPEATERETPQLDEQFAIAVGEEVIARLETYFKIKEAHKPKQAHFYLDILGVLPKNQGRGIGKALLQTIHKMFEESPQSCGVALDTENESNVDLYRRFSYSVSATNNLDNLKVWSMFRANSI